jgi:hypothetical protein
VAPHCDKKLTGRSVTMAPVGTATLGARVAHVAKFRSISKKALDRASNASSLGRGSESRVLWLSVSPPCEGCCLACGFVNALAEIFQDF